MQLDWMEFKNNETGLEIQKIHFNKDITLLVGLSGVGKTIILKAIEYSLGLAVDKHPKLHPYACSLGFNISKDEYLWKYEIGLNEKEEGYIDDIKTLEFISERLEKNGQMLFERKDGSVKVLGYEKVPLPQRDVSMLSQYADDDKFKMVVSEIKKLFPIEVELGIRRGIGSDTFRELKSYIDEKIRKTKNISYKFFSGFPVQMKLYVVKRHYYDIYISIFEAIKELFKEIEDVDVVEDTDREIFVIAIRVYGKWLMQKDISNGMLKSIYYIVELKTMSENAVVLIDEFENGLGVNCIDALSEVIFSDRSDLQFVITSHHPKIINYIDKEKWKIIDRNVSTVKNSNSADYGIGNSQHDAYFQLINRWEFEGSI